VELPGFVRDAPTLWCGTAAAAATDADSGAEPALGKGAIVQVRAGCRVECLGCLWLVARVVWAACLRRWQRVVRKVPSLVDGPGPLVDVQLLAFVLHGR
jgi:hypothetical protein